MNFWREFWNAFHAIGVRFHDTVCPTQRSLYEGINSALNGNSNAQLFRNLFRNILTESRQKYLFFRNGSVVIKTQSRNRPTTKTETHNQSTHRRAVTNDAGGRDTASMADVDAALAFLAPDETGTCSPRLPKRAWTRVDDARLRPSARSSPQILKF